MRVLIVDDERKVASFIASGFEEEGYSVDVAHDGEEAILNAIGVDYDAVVLDLMLPKLSGLDVLARLRLAKPRLPVIMLTAKGEVDDRIGGLDRGADDYMVKPFAFAELSARVRALLRRGGTEITRLCVSDLELDTSTRIVRRAGRKIELRLKEYSLLEFLMRNANRPVTRTMITEHVWDIHFDSVSNIVDVHINSLRGKIDKDFPVRLIQTVRGVGYMLSDQTP